MAEEEIEEEIDALRKFAPRGWVVFTGLLGMPLAFEANNVIAVYQTIRDGKVLTALQFINRDDGHVIESIEEVLNLIAAARTV